VADLVEVYRGHFDFQVSKQSMISPLRWNWYVQWHWY